MNFARKIRFATGTLALIALTSAAHADEKGTRILREAFRKLGAAQSMQANIVSAIEGEDITKVAFKGTVSAMKPNLLLFDVKGELRGKKVGSVNAADGKDYYTLGGSLFNFDLTHYHKDKDVEKPTEFSGEWEGEIDAFFGGEKNLAKGEPDFFGIDKVGTTPCDVIKMKLKARDNAPERTITYYVGQRDHLIYKASWIIAGPNDTELTQSNTLSEINLRANKKADDFKYTLPKDAKLDVPKKVREII